jgi:site-specific DNA-methyltransferase (adenine-specific)
MLQNNQIILGDCLTVLRSLPNDCVDCIITDPPYGINFKSHKQNYDTRSLPIKKQRSEYFAEINGDQDIPVEWLLDAYRVLKNNCAIYIFCHWKKWHILFTAVTEVGFKVKNMIIVNKSNHGLGDLFGSYAGKHEIILFAAKGRHILKKRLNDIWDMPVKYSGAKRFHPNEKPVSWLIPAIENSTNEGDLILDPFAGSGSTVVACQQTKRNFIVIENDEKYYDIMKNRIEGEELCQLK